MPQQPMKPDQSLTAQHQGPPPFPLPTDSRLSRHLRRLGPTTAAPLLLVSGAAVGMSSVPRYSLFIVLTYVALAAVLAVTTIRPGRRSTRDDAPSGPTPGPTPGPAPGPTPGPTTGPLGSRPAGVLALAATGLLVLLAPSFSYLPEPEADAVRLVVALAAGAGALAVALPWRAGSDVALALAAMAYTATAAAQIRLDPAPRIDVWYILGGAADGLLHGQDMYQQVFVGPPGKMAAFTYLPWMAVLLAPGRWLASDVRWMLVVLTLCTSAAFVALGTRATASRVTDPETVTLRDEQRRVGRVAGALLLLLPGTLTQIEQAWTEPVLLACLTGAVLALTRGRNLLVILGVALALASKQHVVLLLPVLAAWPRFGLRRTVASALTAGVLVLPWFVADPAAMWHDTVTLLVDFAPLKFADTLYIAVLNETGVQLPFWLTGAVVVATIGGAAFAVHRRDPDLPEVLRWCALVLFIANLVNKQAFYNQYWLVAGLVLASWAATPSRDHAQVS